MLGRVVCRLVAVLVLLVQTSVDQLQVVHVRDEALRQPRQVRLRHLALNLVLLE